MPINILFMQYALKEEKYFKAFYVLLQNKITVKMKNKRA